VLKFLPKVLLLSLMMDGLVNAETFDWLARQEWKYWRDQSLGSLRDLLIQERAKERKYNREGIFIGTLFSSE